MTLTADGTTLFELIKIQAEQQPEALAILAPGRTALTYAGLLEHLQASTARLVELGIGRGDCVAAVLPNGPELASAFLAVASVTACAPLNPAFRQSEYEFNLADLNCRAVVLPVGEALTHPAWAAAVTLGLPVLELQAQLNLPAGRFSLSSCGGMPAAPPGLSQGEEPCLLVHTSGTTARPKIIPLTQANLCASAGFICRSLLLTPHDRYLNIMPLFHIQGLICSLSTLVSGGSVVYTPGFFGPRFFDWLAEFQPTWYSASPAIHQAIAARAADFPQAVAQSRLRFIRSSAAALPVQVMADLERIFRTPVVEGYGSSEGVMHITLNPLPPGIRKPGSVGKPGGPEIAIMAEDGDTLLPPGQVGEVVFRGPNVMAGYLNNPEANARAFTNSWFRSGDQGYMDGEGYFYILGRFKEMINRGGEKISPHEVDKVLLEHPAVAQAVTFAMPDAALGEEVAAAVVLRRELAQLGVSEKELRQFVADHLADFKVPRRIVFVEEIPKGPTGKIQRIGLAEKLGLAGSTLPADPQSSPVIPPATPMEIKLAEIWQEVLGVTEIGANQNYFDLGGDSMLAGLVLVRIQARFGAAPSFLDFFDAPTIAEQAVLMKNLVEKARQ